MRRRACARAAEFRSVEHPQAIPVHRGPQRGPARRSSSRSSRASRRTRRRPACCGASERHDVAAGPRLRGRLRLHVRRAFEFVDLLGRHTRVSVPLTWGGERQATVDVERRFTRGPLTRIMAGRGHDTPRAPGARCRRPADRRGRARRARACRPWFRIGATRRACSTCSSATPPTGSDPRASRRRSIRGAIPPSRATRCSRRRRWSDCGSITPRIRRGC